MMRRISSYDARECEGVIEGTICRCIGSLISEMGDVKLPTGSLEIEEYEDKTEYLSYGEIKYVILPRGTKSLGKNKQNEN